MTQLGTFTFAGPAGSIEALYKPGSAALAGAAVLSHPHPQFGGTMHNKVVFRAAKAFERLGYPTLRFNFRGVGRSRGTFDEGAGEAEDVKAALDWMAGEHPGLAIVHCGFSFGNAIGTPVAAAHERVDRLVCLGTPTASFRFERLAHVVKPKLFVQGEHDEHGPLKALRDGLALVAQPWTLVVVSRADHFFAGHLEEMERAIVGYFSDEELPT
ncbi:MAG TPA: alpha/beta fold hydrolase [Gemmatimonadota bacterium]|nr:alpha/beta fold hydrolase [Gemmatimonadota bacterium]